jgi:hypothetical protein
MPSRRLPGEVRPEGVPAVLKSVADGLPFSSQTTRPGRSGKMAAAYAKNCTFT